MKIKELIPYLLAAIMLLVYLRMLWSDDWSKTIHRFMEKRYYELKKD